MNCKVSVIVPVYNVEKFLDKCVGSIVNQTYSNLEIILVDDGSPDNCPAICEEWAKKDSRIKVIHKENGGLSSARNAGLDIFTGEYVMFVDSDDWIDENTVEIFIQTSENETADIVCGGMCFEYMNDTHSALQIQNASYKGEEIARNLLLDNIRPEVCGKIYLRDLIRQFRFDEKIRYAEDLHFNFYLMMKANKLVAIDFPSYHYLQNSGISITSPYITDARAASWQMFDGIFKTVRGNKGLEDAAVYRFTIYTFAVLSRVLSSKEFRKKYFSQITFALLQYKNKILNNELVSKKHKTALKILAINKNLYLTLYKVMSCAAKIHKQG